MCSAVQGEEGGHGHSSTWPIQAGPMGSAVGLQPFVSPGAGGPNLAVIGEEKMEEGALQADTNAGHEHKLDPSS